MTQPNPPARLDRAVRPAALSLHPVGERSGCASSGVAQGRGTGASVRPSSVPSAVRLSIVIPATDAPVTLPRCLGAVKRAMLAGDEVLVVDGPPSLGAAAARNAGAARAACDVLVFVDADVEIHADALTRLRRAFERDDAPAAIFGCYDDSPAAPGLVSGFRNLLHHHIHVTGAGPAETFWAGLGAIRREAFAAVGGFDAARFQRPSVEDIDLGMRLTAARATIELDPAIRGKHLKRWTLPAVIRVDFAARGVPWTGVLLRHRRASTALNLGWRHRVSACACAAGALALLRRRLAVTVACVALLIAVNLRFYALLARRRGLREATVGIALHVVHHLTAVAAVPAGMAVSALELLTSGRRAETRP